MIKAKLLNRRILLVEDDYLIAYGMQHELQDLGMHVVGPAASVKDALVLLDSEPVDGAILDVNLNDEKVFPVAEALVAIGVPFAFTTGYSASDLPAAWQYVTRFEKPVDAAKVVLALFDSDTPLAFGS